MLADAILADLQGRMVAALPTDNEAERIVLEAPNYKGRLKPTPSDYQARGARFSRLLSLPGTANVAAVAKRSPSLLGRAERFERAAMRVSRSVSLATPSTLLLEGDLACWVATFASLQKQRRSREVWYRHVYSQLKASSDRAI
jgi:hypothetical protein